MKVFPSTSVTVAPFALAMKSGVPPTDRKARTGEFTPPGMIFVAARNSFRDFLVVSLSTRPPNRTNHKIGRIVSATRGGVKETIRWKIIRFFELMQNGIINWLDTREWGGVKAPFVRGGDIP